MSDVLIRLGNVLYWTANIFAGLCVLGGFIGAIVIYSNGREVAAGLVTSILIGMIFAGICHVIGRAAAMC